MPRISLIASVAWIDADDPGQHAEHAALGAARHQSRRRRLGIEAAVARAVLGREHRRLPLEAEDASVGIRLAEQHAGVVDEVARREVVGAVDDDVVRREQIERVRGRERRLVEIDLHVRVDARAGDRARNPACGGRRRPCRA